IFTDIKGLSLKLKTLALGLEAFLKEEHLPQKVKWVEAQLSKMGENQQLVTADLDIAPALSKALFDPFQTVILSSATLAAGRSFRFIKERIGISLLPHKEPLVEEHIYNSPFNFQQQALLVVPNDLPSANHPNYYQDIAAQVLAAIEASHGSAFVLFTSYHALSRCYSLVAPELIKKGFTLLKHGEDSRQALLKLFGEKKRPVLFGTDSFWEGVDVQGSGLKLVILVKLPFQVPNEPLVEAKKELFIAQGKDPFMEYSLPNAVVKFKQGFGRLIRRKSDYGVVLCLDPRLIQKGYGRLFLSSLPDCPLLITPQKELASHLKLFYKKQYRRRLGAS
ncbi:MAG: hypothetical protein K0S07_1131, partial [Chlamydiales bacterium]|nr:hypothetical protein [Chlamydiales bacterium]